MRLRHAIVGTGLIATGVLGLLLHTWFARPLRLDWLFARVAIEQRLEGAAAVDESAWWGRFASPTPDYSPEAERDRLARAGRSLSHWRGFDCADYAGIEGESCRVLGHALELQVEGGRWRLYSFPVNPLFGAQANLPAQLIGPAGYRDWAQADAAIARLQDSPRIIDGLLAALDERRTAGLLPPRSLVRQVLRELRAFTAVPAQQNALMAGFRERVSRLASDPAEARRQQREQAALLAVERDFYPAWQRLIAHFEALDALSLTEDGAWSRPQGEAWYAYSIRVHLGEAQDPLRIHAQGLAEVARLEHELDPRLRAFGLQQGSVGERLRQLAAQPEQQFASGAAGGQAALTAVRHAIVEARGRAGAYFDQVDAAPIQVQAVPLSRQASAPLAYYVGARGEAGGTLFVNLRDPAELPRFSLPTLIHHEVIPGHHLQLQAQARAGLPAFRAGLTFSAYSEGWAMYAEHFAGEIGMTTDAAAEIGRLQSELFRAARLVVDTGLHHQRWSRQRAIDYLRQRVGLGPRDATAEVDRYLVYPAQALSFTLGMQALLDMRAAAQSTLGERFRWRDFHRAVLAGGRMPLPLLRQRVQGYIEAAARGPAQASLQGDPP